MRGFEWYVRDYNLLYAVEGEDWQNIQFRSNKNLDRSTLFCLYRMRKLKIYSRHLKPECSRLTHSQVLRLVRDSEGCQTYHMAIQVWLFEGLYIYIEEARLELQGIEQMSHGRKSCWHRGGRRHHMSNTPSIWFKHNRCSKFSLRVRCILYIHYFAKMGKRDCQEVIVFDC